MSLPNSIKFLNRCLDFQFGTQRHVFAREVISWLQRKESKRGGLIVRGPANSGKTFVMQALTDLFQFVGRLRPTAGYAFSFDECADQQILLFEAFSYNSKDSDATETLKDLLAGTGSNVRIKNRDSKFVEGLPMIY